MKYKNFSVEEYDHILSKIFKVNTYILGIENFKSSDKDCLHRCTKCGNTFVAIPEEVLSYHNGTQFCRYCNNYKLEASNTEAINTDKIPDVVRKIEIKPVFMDTQFVISRYIKSKGRFFTTSRFSSNISNKDKTITIVNFSRELYGEKEAVFRRDIKYLLTFIKEKFPEYKVLNKKLLKEALS